MHPSDRPPAEAAGPLLTLPAGADAPLSIRAKALLFHDPRSLALLQQAERLAQTDATVLIIGETGTGKELLARHLHQRSGRRGPFIAVNCGAFSESLIDAELFGHEAGAFTGAGQARAGWFEAAQGGTLFLDEIGDLPLPLQVKLLRVLQERQVVRLGSRRPIALDVRLVAATNVDLQQAVRAQRFRADLYWRLAVAQLLLPPLRERPGDILPLARYFMGLYARRLGAAPAPALPTLTPEAEALLLHYPWPGNIRELENVVHFGLIVSRDGRLSPEHLQGLHHQGLHHQGLGPAGPHQHGPHQHGPHHLGPDLPGPVTAPQQPGAADPVGAAGAAPAAPAAPAAVGLGEAPADALAALPALFERLLAEARPGLFDRVEAALVATAFVHSGHNQVRAARLLGISRNSVRTLLKRHGHLPGDDADRVDAALPADPALSADRADPVAAAGGVDAAALADPAGLPPRAAPGTLTPWTLVA